MIGIFDSGFGGLTVMREYLKKYPDFDYVYLGDQANNPYGPHSRQRVEKLTLAGVGYLVKQGCKLIIVACNTASADALRAAQEKYKGKPAILGVIIPAVEKALTETRFGNIGVIGTRGVIKAGAYQREIEKYSVLYAPEDKRARKTVKVTAQACPLLVPLVEEGMTDHPATRMILKNYLRPLKNANTDTLILGCTHYPLLEKEIDRIMGKNCRVISSAKAAAESIESYFEEHPDLLKKLSRKRKRIYLTTDCAERFAEIGARFLGEKIKVDKIEIKG
jgi:glutamate racemase